MGCRWSGDVVYFTSHVARAVTLKQFMSASANVLVSASFPTSVSSDWQIRVVLIGNNPAASVDHMPKVSYCTHFAVGHAAFSNA